MTTEFAIVSWLVFATLLGLGNTVGYHRLLTHRSFKATGWVRATFTLLGAAHSGSPVLWVGLHRYHHARSDTEDDPHSPKDGFWAGHTGWLINAKHPLPCILFALSGFGQQLMILIHDVRRLMGKNPPTWRSVCADLMKERLMRTLDTPMVMPLIFMVQVVAVWMYAGWWGILWLWALHAAMTNSSWAINSICHWPRFGEQPFDTGDDSRDVPWVAWFTNGEGFHNSHHRFPKSACHALHGGPDLSWAVIRVLIWSKLASDPWVPRSFREKLLPANNE